MAKRSLSQNFLKSDAVLERIADAVDITEGETVLEIGPGHGELTRKLLNRGAHVVAVEKDDDLATELKETFSTQVNAEQLTIVHTDITTFDLSSYQLQTTSYKCVGNIPYNITGKIIRHFLTAARQPSRMVLLVQKEVAERVTARDGKESLLSISVKAYGTPRTAGTVKAGSFEPQPNVDSAILVIKNISRQFFSDIDEERFFELLRIGFQQKRKQLLPKLKNRFSINKTVFETCNVQPTQRAEELSVGEWSCIARMIF